MKKYSICIYGFDNPTEFVSKWSKCYIYKNGEKYKNNIDTALDNYHSFYELFVWKNGTGEKLFNLKTPTVDKFWENIHELKKMKYKFSWEYFEKYFGPLEQATIWKIFLLHLMNPSEFPIFDQHVNRFYQFIKTGKIK